MLRDKIKTSALKKCMNKTLTRFCGCLDLETNCFSILGGHFESLEKGRGREKQKHAN